MTLSKVGDYPIPIYPDFASPHPNTLFDWLKNKECLLPAEISIIFSDESASTFYGLNKVSWPLLLTPRAP
jgi:hypothetical protein